MAGPAIKSFGKYQILERIATGGMAEIYKARLEGIGGFQRTFAIKRILPNLSQNADYIAMLVDEAKVAGLLSHANIVQILDLGQVDGIWFIAMEYVHGPDLGAVLRRARDKGLQLPVPHAVFIAIELLKGLEYAHQRQVMRGGRPVALNIIHRDISPPNILLSYQGEVKLTDFGIARANLRAMETVSGIVKGRFDYMSPEQAAGARDLDQRSDLFSVGVVLYEILTGHHPFRADNELQTVERVRTGTYLPVSQRNRDVPQALEIIVDRALRVERDARYPSATAFKEALDRFFHESGFLFTHATLASYVKGLFPEADARGSGLPAPNRQATPTRSRGADDVDLFPESPTHAMQRPPQRLDSGVTPALGLRIDDAPTERRAPYADPEDEDNQETVIRKVPEGWEDASSTLRGIDLEPDGQQETLIRRSPLADEESSISGLQSVSSPREELGIRSRTTTSSGRTSSGRSTGGRRRRREQATVIGWLGWVLTAVGLLLGLLLGAGGVATLGWVAGFRIVPRVDPAVRIVAPKGTQIRVNGDAVGSEVTVEAGVEHEIEVHLRNHEPWVQRVVLQPGEERVFVVSPVQTGPE